MGIAKTSTEEEIKRSYKKLAIKFHPDKNQSIHAAEAFKKVKNNKKLEFRFLTHLQL